MLFKNMVGVGFGWSRVPNPRLFQTPVHHVIYFFKKLEELSKSSLKHMIRSREIK